MANLVIIQAKPNPTGKDRISHFTPLAQLAGEWVDIKNNTTSGINLSNIEIYHRAYTSTYPQGKWEKVFSIDWVLPQGDILRIHSGKEITLSLISYQDRIGADWHAFTGKDYIWNNDKSDAPLIFNAFTRTTLDKATYSANPLEGKVLIRKGDFLI